MTTWVAVLYSIVLPAGKRLVMADLKDVSEGLGLVANRTYGATGNLIFEARHQSPATLEKKLEAAYETRFGKRIDIIVRTAADWRKMVAGNPFPDDDGARVAVRIMRDRIPQSAEAGLKELCTGGEKVAIVDGDFWAYFSETPASTRLLRATARDKQGIGTLRNANVVRAIADMLD